MSDCTGADAPEGPETKVSKKQAKLYKTDMCERILRGETCPFGNDCSFAHSAFELQQRERPPSFKTRVCEKFARGECKYGRRCKFKHDVGACAGGDRPAASLFSAALNVPRFDGAELTAVAAMRGGG